MIMMVSEGFGLLQLKDISWIAPIAHQFDHQEWEGMRFWDLIQPFFMFIVGTVMVWSFEKRWERGETWSESLRHVLKRSALLIFWGLVARSVRAGRPIIDVINVLAQIAVTYPIAFLLLKKSWRTQIGWALALLAIHSAAYFFYGYPWLPSENLGEAIDRAIFGKNWGGHYATINCFSSAANTIFGVVAGQEQAASARAPGRRSRRPECSARRCQAGRSDPHAEGGVEQLVPRRSHRRRSGQQAAMISRHPTPQRRGNYLK